MDIQQENPNRERAAEKEIDYLIEQFHGRYDLVDILPVVARRYSSTVLDFLLKRIQRKWDELPIEKQIFVTQFKSSLEKR